MFEDASYYWATSEPELDRGYADLCLLRRPEARVTGLNDVLIEFKFVKLTVTGLNPEQLRSLDDPAIAALKPVAAALGRAEEQLERYGDALSHRYGDWLRLRAYAVVAVGFERLIAREVAGRQG